jgi:photosystem II stability/assembly factor-like uncharacterized protein
MPAWFGRIVVNTCRDELRRRARRPPGADVRLADPLPDPSVRDQAVERDEVARALSRLAPDARVVLGDVAGDLQWPGAAVTADGGMFALTVDAASGDGSATFNLGFTDGRDWKPYAEFSGLPAPGTTPTTEPTPPPQPAIADGGVAFFDAHHGIALGGNGGSQSYLWRTADGGATWTIAPASIGGSSALAVHGSSLWAAIGGCPADVVQPNVQSDALCNPSIARSRDGGQTWTTVGHALLTSISFGDAVRGFRVGPLTHPSAGNPTGIDESGISTTSDGGSTWTLLKSDDPCGGLKPVSVSFVSASRGWVGCGGMGGAGQASKGVMETTDGGKTWAWRSRVYGPSGSPTNVGTISISDYLTDLSMGADGHGMWVGGRDSTFRTADSGRTWEGCPPGEFDAFVTSQASIVPGGLWFVIQSGNNIDPAQPAARLMRSEDQGATWTQVGGLLPSP